MPLEMPLAVPERTTGPEAEAESDDAQAETPLITGPDAGAEGDAQTELPITEPDADAEADDAQAEMPLITGPDA